MSRAYFIEVQFVRAKYKTTKNHLSSKNNNPLFENPLRSFALTWIRTNLLFCQQSFTHRIVRAGFNIVKIAAQKYNLLFNLKFSEILCSVVPWLWLEPTCKFCQKILIDWSNSSELEITGGGSGEGKGGRGDAKGRENIFLTVINCRGATFDQKWMILRQCYHKKIAWR